MNTKNKAAMFLAWLIMVVLVCSSIPMQGCAELDPDDEASMLRMMARLNPEEKELLWRGRQNALARSDLEKVRKKHPNAFWVSCRSNLEANLGEVFTEPLTVQELLDLLKAFPTLWDVEELTKMAMEKHIHRRLLGGQHKCEAVPIDKFFDAVEEAQKETQQEYAGWDRDNMIVYALMAGVISAAVIAMLPSATVGALCLLSWEKRDTYCPKGDAGAIGVPSVGDGAGGHLAGDAP